MAQKDNTYSITYHHWSLKWRENQGRRWWEGAPEQRRPIGFFGVLMGHGNEAEQPSISRYSVLGMPRYELWLANFRSVQHACWMNGMPSSEIIREFYWFRYYFLSNEIAVYPRETHLPSNRNGENGGKQCYDPSDWIHKDGKCGDPTSWKIRNLMAKSIPKVWWPNRLEEHKIVCSDPTAAYFFERRPNKIDAECVMAHHYVLRPYTQVIYDPSLRLTLPSDAEGPIHAKRDIEP